MPVTLTLHYTAADVSGMTESSLRVATFAGGILAAAAGRGRRHAGQDGLGRDHAPVAVRDHRRGSGQDVRDRAGNPDLRRAQRQRWWRRWRAHLHAPTCAGATDACGQFPGAAMDSCIDGAKGYTASCCFAATAPICFGVGAGAGCTDPGTSAGGGGGSGGARLPAPAALRDGQRRVRRLSGRDAAGVH